MKNSTPFFKRLPIFIAAISILPLLFMGCEKGDSGSVTPDIEGIYIVNEGIFGSSNGSITMLDPESGEKVDHYFKTQNGRSPGDVLQDLSFAGSKAFIIANNSKKVEIVNKEDFSELDFIPELSYPRQFMAVTGEFGYLTNGSSGDGSNGHVLKINLKDHTITDSIEVGKGPESMMQLGDLVYVTNSGGHLADNTVSVIDSDNDKVIETIRVGDIPTDIEKDRDDNLWVLCKGLGAWQDNGPTNSSLVKINTGSNETTSFDIGKITSYGNHLLAMSPKKDSLFYTGAEGIYKMSIDAEQAPASPVINKTPYGVDVNPENGRIYCLVSNFQSKGHAFRYDNSHTLIDSIQVGYGPNMVVFKE
jgi:YVTN family beta-propeller protein